MAETTVKDHVKDYHNRWQKEYPDGSRKVFRWRCMAQRVMFVAVVNVRFDERGEIGFSDWAVYCDAVPGLHHPLEYEAVAANGDKVEEALAKYLFPDIAELEGLTWRH